MPSVSYTLAIVDLTAPLAQYEQRLSKDTRKKIRQARKKEVYVVEIDKNNSALLAECQTLIKRHLAFIEIPYDQFYKNIVTDSMAIGYGAMQNGQLLSCYFVTKERASDIGPGDIAVGRAFAWDNNYPNERANYLLFWEMFLDLRAKGFSHFNFGLLQYMGCPDPALASVAKFKQQWGLREVTRTDYFSWPKFLYYRFLKRFHLVRKAFYFFKIKYSQS